MLPPWEDRPITVAHLLNPAFCGEIIRRCAVTYQQARKDKQALPFQIAFLILPLILYPPFRKKLPQKSNKSLRDWLVENPIFGLELLDIIKRLMPYSRESIMFLMMYKVIKINNLGEIEVIIPPMQKKMALQDNEGNECFYKADFLGKWLAASGNSQTIFTNFGIKP